jgi:hypothetical protein
MNTVTKPYLPSEKVVPLKPKRTRKEKLSPQPYSTNNRQPVKEEVATNKVPLWLSSFFFLHNTVSLLTFALIATTLGIYTLTVYTPEIWSQEYKKLRTLQRDERQLTATNETLKNQLAQQAENPQTGLVDPSYQNAPIFIPVQPLPGVKSTPTTTVTDESVVETNLLGY